MGTRCQAISSNGLLRNAELRWAWRSELIPLGGGAWLALLGWHCPVQPHCLARPCEWKSYKINEAGRVMIRGGTNLPLGWKAIDPHRAASLCRVSNTNIVRKLAR